MISFAHPAYLWALSALAIPLAIHLLSRKEGKIIYVGSLRHLQESNTKQSLNIRLNELLLLALRMLMITFLVLWIAGLQMNADHKEKKWVLVEKGIQHHGQLKTVFDSLTQAGYEMHYLAPGFPNIADSLQIQEVVNYRDLALDLKRQPLSNAVVFAHNRMESFRGLNTPLPISVQWIAVETEPTAFALHATRVDGNHLLLRRGFSNQNETNYETLKLAVPASETFYKLPEQSDSIPIIDHKDQVVLLVSDSTCKDDASVILAALRAIQDSPNTKIDIKTTSAPGFKSIKDPDWIIWLSQEPYSGSQSANKIIFKRDVAAPMLKQFDQHTWIITKNLNEGIALQQNLPIRLSQILTQYKTQPEIASRNDRRMVDESMSWTRSNPTNMVTAEASVLHSEEASWILALLILTLLIERAIAHNKKQ